MEPRNENIFHSPLANVLHGKYHFSRKNIRPLLSHIRFMTVGTRDLYENYPLRHASVAMIRSGIIRIRQISTGTTTGFILKNEVFSPFLIRSKQSELLPSGNTELEYIWIRSGNDFQLRSLLYRLEDLSLAVETDRLALAVNLMSCQTAGQKIFMLKQLHPTLYAALDDSSFAMFLNCSRGDVGQINQSG